MKEKLVKCQIKSFKHFIDTKKKHDNKFKITSLFE